MKHKRNIFGTGLLVVLLAVSAIVLLQRNKDEAQLPTQVRAQSVPPNASFAQVKELSVGSKPTCLADDEAANKRFDSLKPDSLRDQFGYGAATAYVMDVPAGTADLTINSFDGNEAKGTLTYTGSGAQAVFVGNLKTFNYTANIDTAKQMWQVTNFIACQ